MRKRNEKEKTLEKKGKNMIQKMKKLKAYQKGLESNQIKQGIL